jgi:hypothetical protein
MTVDKWISDVRGRLAAATPGSWKTRVESGGDSQFKAVGPEHAVESRGAGYVKARKDAEADAELIAHAPSDLARALDEIERLQSVLSAEKRLHEDTFAISKDRRDQITQLQKQNEVLREGLETIRVFKMDQDFRVVSSDEAVIAVNTLTRGNEIGKSGGV